MAKRDWIRILLTGLAIGLDPAIISNFGWIVFAGFVLAYTALLYTSGQEDVLGNSRADPYILD